MAWNQQQPHGGGGWQAPPQQGGWQQSQAPPPGAAYGQHGAPPPGQYGAPPQQGGWQQQQQQAHPAMAGGPPPAIGADRLGAIFRQVDADRSGSVSAVELKRCMESCGYKFSGEACKMMVNMFDRDGNGQITFDEFVELNKYIEQMQNAFRAVDTDRSGKLEPNEVQQALATSGYRLTPQTFQALMRKFDRHRSGGLGFDGYIELCVFIGTVRNVYASFDTQHTGQVVFSFDQFLYASNRTNML